MDTGQVVSKVDPVAFPSDPDPRTEVKLYMDLTDSDPHFYTQRDGKLQYFQFL
jgi:hypothetical protein